ncbi:MAG: hypothetical protein OEM63_03155 [Gammaproteobacteria bacterium]|nr:hypothetical protein [Gammaproteobacteria bacterium]
MMKSMWIYAVAATITVAASGVSYLAGVQYLPSILMFVAAMIVLGLSMNIEDNLLARYDTPHDDDHHPPQLVSLRATRAIVMLIRPA